jgi:hypothetical protein
LLSPDSKWGEESGRAGSGGAKQFAGGHQVNPAQKTQSLRTVGALCSGCALPIIDGPVLHPNMVYCSIECASAATAAMVIPGQYYG